MVIVRDTHGRMHQNKYNQGHENARGTTTLGVYCTGNRKKDISSCSPAIQQSPSSIAGMTRATTKNVNQPHHLTRGRLASWLKAVSCLVA
jgi:hypothetical protein